MKFCLWDFFFKYRSYVTSGNQQHQTYSLPKYGSSLQFKNQIVETWSQTTKWKYLKMLPEQVNRISSFHFAFETGKYTQSIITSQLRGGNFLKHLNSINLMDQTDFFLAWQRRRKIRCTRYKLALCSHFLFKPCLQKENQKLHRTETYILDAKLNTYFNLKYSPPPPSYLSFKMCLIAFLKWSIVSKHKTVNSVVKNIQIFLLFQPNPHFSMSKLCLKISLVLPLRDVL